MSSEKNEKLFSMFFLYMFVDLPKTMSSPESKELMKLFKCSTDIVTRVVCAYVDSNILPKYGGSFHQYLETEKHFFYHLSLQHNTACCSCPPAGCIIRRTKRIPNWIFNTFYDDNGNVDRNHLMAAGGKCIHKYVTRIIRLENMDIHILCFLSMSSCTLNPQEEAAVQKLKKTRNTICHAWSTNSLSMTQLNDMWTEVESAVSTLTNPFMRPILQSQIQNMRKCDVEKEEIASLSKQLEGIISVSKILFRLCSNQMLRTPIQLRMAIGNVPK